MVISFEEKDRAAIEDKGMTLIEFKRILHKTGKNIEHAWEVLKEFADRIVKAWNVFVEGFLEAVDSVKMMIEVARDVYHCQTSSRYKAVKFLNKCTGIEMWKLWKMTRHTWLVRSHC